MKETLDIGVLGVTILMMVTVGTDLETHHFLEIIRRKYLLISLLALPTLVLPALGYLPMHIWALPPHLGAGILLLAACPVGDIANFYTLLGRGNVAMSITVNTLSCLLSVVTMGLAFQVYDVLMQAPFVFAVPTLTLVLRMTLLVVLPVLAGMGLRHFKPALAIRIAKVLRNASLAGVGLLLACIFVSQRAQLSAEWRSTAMAGAVFMVLAMSCGFGFGWMLRLNARDRFTTSVLFAVRNVGLAMAIAITLLNRVEYAVFAAVYFLTEVPLLLAAVVICWRGFAKTVAPINSSQPAAIAQ